MDDEALVDRIRSTAKQRGATQTDLARIAGMPSQSAMSNVFKGKRKLTIAEAQRLKQFLEIEDEAAVHWVPLIGLASAGAWNEAVQVSRGEFPIPKRIAGKRAFAVEIFGDSMDRLLPEGGWAVVDPDQNSLYGGKVYLIENGEGDVTVKRYMPDPARLVPVSTNSLHEEIDLAVIRYRVIGRVVAYGNNERWQSRFPSLKRSTASCCRFCALARLRLAPIRAATSAPATALMTRASTRWAIRGSMTSRVPKRPLRRSLRWR
jgi:SOS-response transcriptional repressor LexA